MSERGADFLIEWVAANIHPQALPPADASVAADVKARACLSDAAAAGISQAEMEAEVGPLADYMRTSLSIPTGIADVELLDAPGAAGTGLGLLVDPRKA